MEAASIALVVGSKAFVTYGGQCVNLSLSISYHPPPLSFLLSPSLSQTLQERDPNKVKGKQFSHHKPYYSVYPGVLPCRFI